MDQVKRLYDVLVRDGHYTKSFEEFKGRFENEDYQQRVFDVVSKEGLFTKGINEFKSKFVVKKQSVTPPSTSFASDEISLGTPESQFDLTAPKSYSDILKNQAVDENDEDNIRESRSIELQQIQQIAEALGLQDTSEKSVLDELDKINQFEKDLKAKSGQQEKFGKFNKSFFDSEEYKDYRAKKDAIKDLDWNNKKFESAKKNFLIEDTARRSYVQNLALPKYIKTKGLDLEGLSKEDKEAEVSKILNSEEYKVFEGNIANNLTDEQKQEQKDEVNQTFLQNKTSSLLEDRISKELEKQEEESGMSGLLYDVVEFAKKGFTTSYGVSLPSEREVKRSLLEKEAKADLENINKEFKTYSDNLSIINKDMLTIQKQMSDINNYFEKTDPKSFTEQSQVDEYNSKAETFNKLRAKAKQYRATADKMYDRMEPLSEKAGEIDSYLKAVTRSPNYITAFTGNLANSAIDLAQGIAGAADMIFYHLPAQILEDIDDIQTKGFADASDNVPRSSAVGRLNEKIDNFQEENITSQIRKPVEFSKIESATDAVEWGANLLATQAPQLALMTVTGGASLYVMGASSAGNKFYELQNQKDLYYKTGGLYGSNHNFYTMALNASFSGAAEALSEKITLGSINKTKSILGGLSKETVKDGYFNYLKKNVFTWQNTKANAIEFFEEGASESVSTISSNFADILSGDKEKNIYDGVTESFVSGVAISGTIQSPRLFAAMSAPFKSEETNRRTSDIAAELNAISIEMVKLPESFEGTELDKKRSELEDRYAALVEEANQAIEQDVKRVNVLTDQEKADLINIERGNQKIRSQVSKINANSELTEDQRKAKLEDLKQQWVDNANKKQDILSKYPVTEVDAKYKQDIEGVKAYQKEVNDRGVVEINVAERSQQEFEDMISKDVSDASLAELEDFTMEVGGMAIGYEAIVKDPDSTLEEKAEAQAALEDLANKTMSGIEAVDFIKGNARNFGAMTPRFNEKGHVVGMDININKDRALTKGEFNVASHEFVHVAFSNTLKADPIAREKLGGVIDDIIDSGDIKFEEGQREAFDKKINLYDASKKGEEKLTFLTEFVRANKATITETGFDKLKGMFRRFAQTYLGRDIKLDTKQDIVNFIKDYDISIQNNKPNKAIIRMLENGAKGKMFKDARTPQEVKAQTEYSRALEANMKSKPDLKETFDKHVQNPDGTPKYNSQAEFAVAPDFTDAYFAIVEGRSLDALIQQGMTAQGLPPEALREFTRKVKEELGRRFLQNFNLDKNKSLFGWLTGVSGGAGMSIIYRAKGDVMNQYKAEQKAETVSTDAPIGETGTIADVIAEDSSVLDFLEDQDLSVGRRDAIRDVATTELIAKDALNFDQNAKDAIAELAAESGISLDDLTYKGFKKLMVDAMKVDKNGKLKPPTKEADVTPVGALYNILEIVSSEFGVDPLRILANQDLDSEMRRAAQEYILDRSTNQDGSFNDIIFKLLPEGETRSGEATGVANTKLGDFYETGERVKVSEGAAKSLGQKKAQNKKSKITKQEFLDMFNINADGTFRSDKSADGAIKALIVQMAQLTANQELRIQKLANGTVSEAIAAKLADGRSEMVFSADNPAQDIVNDRWPELVGVVTGVREEEGVRQAVDNVYGEDINSEEKEKIVKQITKDIQAFIEVDQVLKGKFDEIAIQTETEFILNQWESRNWEQGINAAAKGLPNIPKGFKAGNVAKDIEGATKARGNLKISARNIFNKHGVSKGLKLIIGHLQPSFAGAGKMGTGGLTVDKPGGNVIVNKNLTRGTENRYQVVESKEDFDALIKQALPIGYSFEQVGKGKYKITNPDGTTEIIKTTLPSESTSSFLKDMDYEGRKKDAEDARAITEDMLDEAWARSQDPKDPFNEQDFVFLVMTLGSSMNAPIRKSANPEYIQDGIQELFEKNPKKINQLTQYEHMKSKELASTEIIQGYKRNGKFDRSVWDGYNVQIITKQHDKLINKAGYQVKSTPDGSFRAYSVGVMVEILKDPAKLKFVRPMRSLDPAKKGTDQEIVGQGFVDSVTDLITRPTQVIAQTFARIQRTQDMMMSKAEPETRGASVFDFDETLIIDGENFIIATNPDTGEQTKISSGDWPIKGPELADKGYTFDFKDFVNVRGGVEGPLFQKLLNRIEKFGPENVFILTARPAESAQAIYEWLKTKGIEIPFDNITGLGNSTGDAKAQWMLEKYEEGYNDMYFVDDALPNVEAVQHVFNQLDNKGKAVQARIEFSKQAADEFDRIVQDTKPVQDDRLDFNIILEQTKGVDRRKRFSQADARNKGKKKNPFKFFLPPSAEDFKGLVYSFLGKGKQGEAHHKFFKDKLFDPFAKAIRAINLLKQSAATDYKQLKKNNKDISKTLKNSVPGTDFTIEQAVRVYNYDRAGYEVPGITQAEKVKLLSYVGTNPKLRDFANAVQAITFKSGGLVEPTSIEWLSGTISSDLNESTELTRSTLLKEWENNVAEVFGTLDSKGNLQGENIEKIRAIYGTDFVEALSDVIYRMKEGTNRPSGQGRLVGQFNQWINGSIASTMFVNARSAVLQTLSTVNFVNWSDNNPLKAGKAFANQKQFWSDFSMIFNSPFLKQRRSGVQQDVNAREMIESLKTAKSPVRAAIGYLLQKGFLPTQIADSFAIAFGGATFYRNRTESYLAEGMTQEDAEAKAFEDFQEIAEETQQSARPDRISMQQASPLGKLILAFQNTPMQYNRLMKRAAQDLINNRGNKVENLSKIVYYGAIQNAIFYSLQQALFALAFGDDDEDENASEKKNDGYARVTNGMLDTLLRGSGIAGAVVSTAKNMILKFLEQEEKGYRADHAYTLLEMLNLSPPVGIKARKLYSATQTWEFNRDVISKMSKTNIDNPMYDAAFSAIEATTNIPLSRAYSKMNNVREALNSDNEAWQRVAMLLGWSSWNFGIQNQDVIAAKQEVKEIKAEKAKERAKQRVEERKIQKQKENEALVKENLEKQKKEGSEATCAAIGTDGTRCKRKPVKGGFCTIHEKVDQRKDGKKIRCKKIKSDGTRCKVETSNKSGFCYYHD